MERFADFIIEKRAYFLAGIIAGTLFFGFAARNLKIKTIYNDLLPQTHDYVKVHNKVRNTFGGANQVLIMVQVKDPEKGGKYRDIFNHETLSKVKFITEELLKFHAVDRYKISSIAHRKTVNFKTTREFRIRPLMFPHVPKTAKGLHDLRLDIYASPMAYPSMVSLDSKSALIMVDFFEDEIDYRTCFKQLQELRRKTEDENHIIAIAGEPMHLGYVDSYVGDVVRILIYTLIAMMTVFFLYFRSIRGMMLPVAAACISAVWGLGFLSLLNFNLDPLVLVFPFLIAARAASHAIQIVKRYEEEATSSTDSKEVCKKVIQGLFIPGFWGIMTDALGIIIIAITPIAILQKICISCAFWAFATVLIAMILVPVLLSYLQVKTFRKGEGLWVRLLSGTGRWITGKGKYIILPVFMLLLLWGSTNMNKVTVGNAVPGSEVLWPFHRYNVDSFRVLFSMPLLNPLYIILDTGEKRGACKASAIREVNRFSRYMRNTPNGKVIFILAIQEFVQYGHTMIWETNPKWIFLPDRDRQVEALFQGMLFRGGPGAWDRFVDHDNRSTNIIIYCRDKTAQTVKEVMGRVKKYISEVSDMPDAREKYKLAGGAVGIQAAINETLTEYQVKTLVLALLSVFICCTILFRSFIAGLFLLLALLFSNALTFTFMALNYPPIPLTTATLPVAAVGIGVGVDFGIYLVSRIKEEFKKSGDLSGAVIVALGTTGKAIVCIATTLICGIVFWFFSKMMFQAVMGLLLAIVLMLNVLGALFVIPSLIVFFKPRFIVGKK
jgi:hypothetical protein